MKRGKDSVAVEYFNHMWSVIRSFWGIKK